METRLGRTRVGDQILTAPAVGWGVGHGDSGFSPEYGHRSAEMGRWPQAKFCFGRVAHDTVVAGGSPLPAPLSVFPSSSPGQPCVALPV